MNRLTRLTVVALLSIFGVTAHLCAQMSAILSPSSLPPSTVGTMITWTATPMNAAPGTLWYRFRAGPAGRRLAVIKDYGPDATFNWTATENEGLYEIAVSVRNVETGETAVVSSHYQMLSNVTGVQPVITPTDHPLVFLYSAPPCEAGSRMKVQFQTPDGLAQQTPYKPCRTGLSMNFYLAGLQPETAYSTRQIVETNSVQQAGPDLSFTTGAVPSAFASQTVLNAPSAQLPSKILLQATLFTNTIATDLNGNLLWYYPAGISFLTRPEPGGYFFGIIEDPSADQSGQIVREFDLVGMTVRETNAARVSEQLVAKGYAPIAAFHHEARRLRDGNILVLASEERILTDVQGPGPVDVLGDMIVVLDPNLQVLWAWDAFDHLDVTRMATLGDMCGPGVCPPFYLSATANDWLHGNCVQETPDGNLLYSTRSQDWLVKIAYDSGNGSGDIIWRLGNGGDFQIDSTDPNPWFSHQHDPQFLPGDNSTLTLFDNGNVRNAADPNANSRGQVIALDEQNRVARLSFNFDLGQYSFALGAAQRLANGDYHFDIGYLSDGTSTSVEIDPAGNTVYALHAGAPEYRSFRMRDMYTPE